MNTTPCATALSERTLISIVPRREATRTMSPGDMVRVASRRGTIDIKVRAEGGVAQGVVFIPFAYVEAAANLLTNPKLDPFGKIPEFKYCAVKVEALGEPGRQAAE